MKLPLDARIDLAQRLWDSVGEAIEPSGTQDEAAILAEAIRRADELDSGQVRGIPFDEVLAAARARLR